MGLFPISICLLSFVIYTSNALQCMDENNNPVDWFVAYKLPKISKGNALEKNGVAYAYLTANDYSSWKFSKIGIDNAQSVIGHTLNELYKTPKNYGYIFYNDEPPTRAGKYTTGHTKGVVGAASNGGFWLVHSVPKLGDLGTGQYRYPDNGKYYGQAFLCITLDLKNLNNVGTQLQYNQPDIYEENVPAQLKASLPEFAKAAAGTTIKAAPWSHVINLVSKGGSSFTSFAKSKGFGKDLYEDLVAPTLEANLLVESWRHGTGLLNSDCTKKYKVNNVKSVKINAANQLFQTVSDHSKWAVSVIGDKPWICIGDINRAEAQKHRGGGTVCFNKEPVVKVFRDSVASIEECKSFWGNLWHMAKTTYDNVKNKFK